MKVTLLGTGMPMSADRFQSSALMEVGAGLLLLNFPDQPDFPEPVSSCAAGTIGLSTALRFTQLLHSHRISIVLTA